MPPPAGAVPPDDSPGEFGFDFTRFGARVPAVLVSPLIPAGTVFRVADGAMPLDHTSVLKTVETRWGLPALTRRDAAAPDVGGALTLDTPRTDDPLAGVVVPVSSGQNPAAAEVSHLQQLNAQLTAALPVPAEQLALRAGAARHAHSGRVRGVHQVAHGHLAGRARAVNRPARVT